MTEGNVFSCHTTEAWRSKLLEAIDAKRLVVVDFTATWCGPCQAMIPIFVELSKKYPQVSFLEIDVDILKDLAKEWDVMGVPTFMFINNGIVVEKLVGPGNVELERKISHHLDQVQV